MFAFLLRTQKPENKLPPLHFHNTLSGTLDRFEPLSEHEVKMYNCGPTVYGTQHIGNMRAAVFADLLRRVFGAWGYQVKQAINITDFGHLSGDNQGDADTGEDRMTLGLKREGMALTLENMRTLATKYMEEYFHDIDALGVGRKSITFPRASDYIADQISLISSLEEKGYAYVTDQGVYFNVSRFPAYGKLGNINLSGLKEGARVQENAHKHGPLDFILWKSDKKLGWESPWGLGFPGWHIECTAMIFTILGKQIDVHTGGIEHIPVHHNNEIAQAEAATGKRFSTQWLHYDHITIEGKKISKSLGNTIYLHNIIDRGINPYALRYWFMTAHYRSMANFTWDALEAAETARARLNRMYAEYGVHGEEKDLAFEAAFYTALASDLDTPRALALVWEYMKNATATPAQKYAAITLANQVLGLGMTNHPATKLTVLTQSDLPEEVQTLVAEREAVRANKDFAKSDELRARIIELGFDLVDSPEGPQVTARG